MARLGHYPDDRSENKGNEPENAEYGDYGHERFLFIVSERSSVVFVYKVKGWNNKLTLVQTLPVGIGFEGIAAVLEGGREILYVAFQRTWIGDPSPNDIDAGGKVRIGRYEPITGDWTFAYYPLDVRQSPNGGWIVQNYRVG